MNDIQEYMIRSCDLLDDLGERFDFLNRLGLDDEGTMSLSRVLRSNLMEFLMYLSAVDDKVSEAEKDFINENLGFGFTVEAINRQIERSGYYSIDYESRPPQILAFAAVMDDALKRIGAELDAQISDVVIEAYRRLGEGFVQCDGEADPDEEKDLKLYLEMMQRHVEENRHEEKQDE